MNKKWLFLIPAAMILAGCAVERLNNVISKGTDGMASPSWDVDFDVPLGKVEAQLSKIDEVNKMLNNLKFTDQKSIANNKNALIYVKIDDMEINGSDFNNIDENVKKAVGSDSVLTWPLPVEKMKSPEIKDTSIPTIKLDLDDDNIQDMMLTKLQSKDGSLKIKLKMQFEDLLGNLRDATRDDYFDDNGKPYIAIEDVTDDYSIQIGDKKFSFKEGVYEGDRLVFETKNFLTDYNNPVTPTKAWLKDGNGNFVYEDDGVTHKLDDVNFEYRVFIPDGALKIYGESFSVIENVLADYTETSSGSRSIMTRSRSSGLTSKEIKARLRTSNGDVTVFETMLSEDGVTLEDVASAYNGNLEDVLTDSGLTIKDIMTSEVIASGENIETLGKEDGGFGLYKLFEETTLGEINKAGNLKSLADFCKFHEKKAVKSIKFNFEVEVDLGDSFIITAEFIKDYEITVNTEESLPLSKLDKILENGTLAADISHNFMCEMKLKNPKIGNKVMTVSGIKSVEDGYYAIPEKPCRILFDLNEMPSADGGAELALLIPKDKTVNIALNPTKETDLWIDMVLGANGTLKVSVDEISNLLGGE